MIPLYDESASSVKPPYITLALILVNIVIFGFVLFSGNLDKAIEEYGMVSSRILEGENFLSLFTSIFLHVNLMHLIGNMWFLWLFGDNLEYNLGRGRFLIFYLAGGIFAGLFYIFGASREQANIPAVGASGAVSALLGGYLILYPKNRIRAFILLFYYPILFWVPAFFYIGLWFFLQLLYVDSVTSIAYLAHIGGFIIGTFMILFLKRKVRRKDYS